MYHLCQRSRVYSTSLQLTLLTNQDITTVDDTMSMVKLLHHKTRNYPGRSKNAGSTRKERSMFVPNLPFRVYFKRLYSTHIR